MPRMAGGPFSTRGDGVDELPGGRRNHQVAPPASATSSTSAAIKGQRWPPDCAAGAIGAGANPTGCGAASTGGACQAGLGTCAMRGGTAETDGGFLPATGVGTAAVAV